MPAASYRDNRWAFVANDRDAAAPDIYDLPYNDDRYACSVQIA